MQRKIILVAGARPNFMKLAPVYTSLRDKDIECIIVHTGQHYDYEMSQIFFDELGIPEPDVNLGVGSGSHASQTAEIMVRFEEICSEIDPWMVVVFGDVNSTIACALVARKSGILVSHIEAGLRSGDMEMPEEINRILTDHISNFLFTTSRFANQNLLNEGLDEGKIFFVGNVMIDTLNNQLHSINNSPIVENLGLSTRNYDVLTLHRPSNVDDSISLEQIISNFSQSVFDNKIVFPAHPRTKIKIEKAGLMDSLHNSGIEIIPPQGYHDFLSLIQNSRSVWTDSGGIQEETSWLGIPCFTIRENTERPETIEVGTNILVSTSGEKSFEDYFKEYYQSKNNHTEIELWDGRASDRIAEIIFEIYGN